MPETLERDELFGCSQGRIKVSVDSALMASDFNRSEHVPLSLSDKDLTNGSLPTGIILVITD